MASVATDSERSNGPIWISPGRTVDDGLLLSIWNEAPIVLWPLSPSLSSVLSIHHLPSLLSLYFGGGGQSLFAWLFLEPSSLTYC